MNVIIAALVLGGSQFVVMVAGALLARWYIERKARKLADRAAGELSALVEGKPTPAAAILNAIGANIGREAGRSAKASLMADLSHAKRAQNADAEADTTGQIAGALPPNVGSALLSMGTKSRRNLMSNPLLQLAFSGLFKSSQPANAGDNNQTSVAERLRRNGG